MGSIRHRAGRPSRFLVCPTQAGPRARDFSSLQVVVEANAVAVFKSEVTVVGSAGDQLGQGTAYVHLPRGLHQPQDSGGTISLRVWAPSNQPPAALALPDGRQLAIDVTRDALSECSRNRVLRFRLRWPGA